MRKFLSILASFMFFVTSFAQTSIQYPKFDVDSNGQQVVILTIEQAQSLDNGTDLLILLEKLNTQMYDYDSVCVKVINDQDKVIASQKIEIFKLRESLNNKDEQIESLRVQISLYVKKISILEEEVSNRQGVIDEKNRQITKMKAKMFIGGIGGAVTIFGLFLTLLMIQ